MPKLSKYEREQVAAIARWQAETPGVLSRAFGIAVEPLAWIIRKVVPTAAVRGALDSSNAFALWLTDTKDVVRDGGVAAISDLRTKEIKLSDSLANEVHNWAIGMAVAEGAGTGAFGILGAPVDIPAIITIALRTIHKVGACYGFECSSELDRKFALSVLAASGANTVEEKASALAALRLIEVTIAKVTWKQMSYKAAENQFGKEMAIISLKNLAKQLGINLTKRRALAAIPAIGALVGGSVNGWYVKEVGWAARRAFQERWLLENGKIDPPAVDG